MEQILTLSLKEQAQIYQEAAARSTVIKSPIIIEKDFWVCWTLKQLFSIPQLSPHITFKGGTSLSKCYNIINRFSEDCDLTLDKRFLEIDEDVNAIATRSINQRSRSSNKLGEAVRDKVVNTIRPLLINSFRNVLDNFFKATEWSIEIDSSESQNLLFHYPSTQVKADNEYIQSVVKLEFGGRGDSNPNELKEITPFAYQILPDAFETIPSILVPTLTAQRTFWEKITLLHAEHHRHADKPPKSRMFRHYYDVGMLNEHGITSKALDDTSLLKTVVTNKIAYFYTSWANYETANIGTIRLLPNEIFVETLRQDCNKMSEMFFGEAPNFYEVMAEIAALEKTINSNKDS